MTMMRKYILSLLAGTATTALAVSAASAADLPVRAAPPPIVAPVPIFTWTGFYAGVNAGWGWRDDNSETVFLGPGPGIPLGLEGTLDFGGGDDGGFTGGGQIGYNFQTGSFVWGVEADIQWADTGNDSNAVFIAGPTFAGTFVPGTFESNTPEWWGSVRARAGVAFDRVLVYATGGLAYTEDNAGWVLGGGVEWALPVGGLFGSLGSAATFGVEGLWISVDEDDDNNIDRRIGTFTPVGGAPVEVLRPLTGGDESEFFVARAKLNFKFGTY
jgi:outer membrane immunogenic protein